MASGLKVSKLTLSFIQLALTSTMLKYFINSKTIAFFKFSHTFIAFSKFVVARFSSLRRLLDAIHWRCSRISEAVINIKFLEGKDQRFTSFLAKYALLLTPDTWQTLPDAYKQSTEKHTLVVRYEHKHTYKVKKSLLQQTHLTERQLHINLGMNNTNETI